VGVKTAAAAAATAAIAAWGRAFGVKSALASLRAALGLSGRASAAQAAGVAQTVEVAGVWRTEYETPGAWAVDIDRNGQFETEIALKGRAA